MRKAFREWVFNLFTKRITVKIANLQDDAKIEYLVNKLMNELVAQGYNIVSANGGNDKFFQVWDFGNKKVDIDSNDSCRLRLKRLPNV